MEQTGFWNNTASEYQRVFRQGQSDYNREQLAFWENEGLLHPGDSVLDVGCGVGKYAVLLAARGCAVTLLDSSEAMLRFAEQNMAEVKTPWRTQLCDFRAMALPEAAAYDFVFSTMSPAIQDESDLRRLTALSRGWCFVSRFCEWSQPVRDAVLTGAGLPPRAPHRDMRADCAALIAGVRALGRTPLTCEVPYDWEDVRTPSEMAESLWQRLDPETAAEAGLRERLFAASEAHAGPDGLLHDAVFTRALWLYWRR